MTTGTGLRLYRACIRCRERKTKCDLQSTGQSGKPPCLKCHVGGYDCVLAGSRRGGDFTRFRAPNPRRRHHEFGTLYLNDGQNTQIYQSQSRPIDYRGGNDSSERRNREGSTEFTLQILAQAAASNDPPHGDMAAAADTGLPSPTSTASMTMCGRQQTATDGPSRVGLESYGPVADRILDPRLLDHLLQHYAELYHPFMPIVPEHLLSPTNIHRTAVDEPILLTAVLTISTKDRPELVTLHSGIWSYMQGLLLGVVLGTSAPRHVGIVEGLLLLAEWVPHVNMDLSSKSTSGLVNDNEDNAALTLVRLAVRQGSLLHLDKYSFRREDKRESKALADRKRLTWTFTYLFDRQISIRMGQAFWCPILQSQVEITTLFGNVHDILYASKSRTVGLMLMGDYTKYLDDSAKALAAWKDAWNSLKVTPYLKALLILQYEYLRLYVNAFTFQAVIAGRRTETAALAAPYGRHICLAINAASNLLKIINEHLDHVWHLYYLPICFYLVFLFKAHAPGAINNEGHQRSTTLVQSFISGLDAAATSEQHIAYRYSKLLSSQWFTKTSPC
ncbi:hypothetical protein BJX68DRAFT_257999 [Aspergillus pseudodeflectus]|uniref:Zn(2)-C6 fungal-type domain-containing protein n=1 Tax=Aspergillus pseudodeflectus TaxID=176178 RepID=A0ABR4JP52_9EURO